MLKGHASLPVDPVRGEALPGQGSSSPALRMRQVRGRRLREDDDLQKIHHSSLKEQRRSLPDSVAVQVDSSDSEVSSSVMEEDKLDLKNRFMGQSFDALISGRVGRSVDELMGDGMTMKHRDGAAASAPSNNVGGKSLDMLIGKSSPAASAAAATVAASGDRTPVGSPFIALKKSSLMHLSRDSIAESEDSFFSADEDDRTTIDAVTLDSHSLPSPALANKSQHGAAASSALAGGATSGPSALPPLLHRSSTETSSVEFLPALSASGSVDTNASRAASLGPSNVGSGQLPTDGFYTASASVSAQRPPSWPTSSGPYSDAKGASSMSSQYTDAKAEQPSSTTDVSMSFHSASMGGQPSSTTEVSFHSALSSYQSRLSYQSAVDSWSGEDEELATLAPEMDRGGL